MPNGHAIHADRDMIPPTRNRSAMTPRQPRRAGLALVNGHTFGQDREGSEGGWFLSIACCCCTSIVCIVAS